MKVLQGFDTPEILTGCAHELVGLEDPYPIQVVGLYMRPDRCCLEMVEGLHSVGIKILSLWEEGAADTPAYHTAAIGTPNGLSAASFAASMGQRAGTPIFNCIDLDASQKMLDGTDADLPAVNIQAEQENFALAVKTYGYMEAVYGSGLVCAWLSGKGAAQKTYLSQSYGWQGYAMWSGRASVKQGAQMQIKLPSGAVFTVDAMTVIDDGVVW